MTTRLLVLAVSFGLVSACTSEDRGSTVVSQEVLEPEVVAEQPVDTQVEEIARQGRCEELRGDLQRQCLELAQYLPEHAQGPPRDPGLRKRHDAEQVETDPTQRIRQGHELGRTTAPLTEEEREVDRYRMEEDPDDER